MAMAKNIMFNSNIFTSVQPFEAAPSNFVKGDVALQKHAIWVLHVFYIYLIIDRIKSEIKTKRNRPITMKYEKVG